MDRFCLCLILMFIFSLMSSAGENRLKDPYAGKTVKDRVMGRSLIKHRSSNVPKVGEAAPDFTLKTMDGKKEVTLSSLNPNKPVVLIFGSYT